MKKKLDKNTIMSKGKGTINEFKAFIAKGNVVDLAVGVIIGNAFGKIVTSLVDNMLMPIVGVLIGGHDFSSLSFHLGDAVICYGAFIQSIVDFIIIAACIFTMIKILGIFMKKQEEKVVEIDKKELLLEEIRDLLKNQN